METIAMERSEQDFLKNPRVIVELRQIQDVNLAKRPERRPSVFHTATANAFLWLFIVTSFLAQT